MPLLQELNVDPIQLLRGISEFRAFLDGNPRGERKDFLPFFAEHLQLAAYLATLNDKVGAATHVGTEVSLWGDFVCDLVAGSVKNRAFVFVEFEDATETSLFRPHKGRKNSRWGMRVES